MGATFHQIAIIFIALLTGFICKKTGVITEQGTTAMSGVVVKIILPMYLFNAIVSSASGVDGSGVATAIILSILLFAFSGIVGKMICKVIRAPKEDTGVYVFEMMFGNVTYLGITLCQAVLGEKAAFYAALLNIPYNLLCFSLGVILLSGKMSLKMVLNPTFISGVLAVIIYVLKISVPSIITDACKFIGQATAPCAMIVVGSVLASVPVKNLFTEWRAIPYVIIRLAVIPFLILILTSFINIDTTLRFVLVIMAAMPAATNSTMLCSIYGGNKELSAKLVFLSTACCIVSLPLWASILEKLL